MVAWRIEDALGCLVRVGSERREVEIRVTNGREGRSLGGGSGPGGMGSVSV